MKENNYEIKTKTQKRVVRFENGVGIWEEYTQYNIFLNDQLVTFVFDEDQVEEAIRHHEWAQAHPTAAARIGSRFD